MRTAAALCVCCLLFATPALACGGYFFPPTTQDPAYEDAERVLFVHDDQAGELRTWLEVSHIGKPESFAWLLPVDGAPTVELGTRYVLDRLDQATAPWFVTGSDHRWSGESSMDFSVGCFAGAAGDGGGSRWGSDSGVVERQEQLGPFDLTVLHPKTIDPLVGWLDKRGFAVPAAARPILADHIKRGHRFVAMKLTPGKDAGDLRPIIVRTKSVEPCMPLRLTSIAAAEQVRIVAWFVGMTRAVPHNMLHARINPLRLDWQAGVSNYAVELQRAGAEAGGRAFVTEFAAQAVKLEVLGRDDFEWSDEVVTTQTLPVTANYHTHWPPRPTAFGPGEAFAKERLDTSGIALAKTSGELVSAIDKAGFPIVADSAAIIDSELGWGEQYGCQDMVAWLIGSSAPCKDAPQALYLGTLEVDGHAVAARLDAEFVAPVTRFVEVLKGQGTYVTRLATILNGDALDRDPIFRFVTDLPAVSNRWRARLGTLTNDARRRRLEVPGLGMWRVAEEPYIYGGAGQKVTPRPTPAPFDEAPSATHVEYFNAAGKAVHVGKAQRELVDEALKSAVPGGPSLPPALYIEPTQPWQPPPSDPMLTHDEARDAFATDPVHCSARERGPPTLLALLLAAIGVVLSRRRRRLGRRQARALAHRPGPE